MPSFGSGYRPDMTPPERKPTLEEINADLLAALDKIIDGVMWGGKSRQELAAIALAAKIRATAAQSDINMGRCVGGARHERS